MNTRNAVAPRSATPPAPRALLRKRSPGRSRNGNRPARIRGFHRSRLSPNVADTLAQLEAAINASSAITSYVTAVIATNLPTLQDPPSWWASLNTNFTNAQTNAMQWVNTLASDFTSIPAEIVNYCNIFSENVNEIQQYCDQFNINGPNSTDEASLYSGLNDLFTQVNQQSSQAAAFATSIAAFAGLISGDSTNLGSAFQQSLQTEGSNQAEVTALQNQINQLNAAIASYNQTISNAVTVEPVSIYVGGIAISLAFERVTFNMGSGIIGVAESLTAIVAAKADIQQAQSQITAAGTAMNTLNQEIAVLSALNTLLSNLVNEVNAAQQEVTAILQTWNGITGGLSSVLADVTGAMKFFKSDSWGQLFDEMTTATGDWDAVQTAASALSNVTYNISNTLIPI